MPNPIRLDLKAFQQGDSFSSLKCFHCGGACGEETLHDTTHVFCCQGCYTVFSLLKQHSLEGYYQIEAHPGARPYTDERWAWLEDKATVSQLLDFERSDLARVHFRLPSMHCAACIWLLEQLYRVQEGILGSEVDFPRREISIRYNPQVISLRQVVELLSSLGYAPALSMADGEKTKQQGVVDRRLWYELGIAAFCFGNIMMTSFPEYFHLEQGAYASLFRWVNMGLSLPVVLFSARSFYRSAIQGLRHRIINMDFPIVLGIVVLFLRSSYEVIAGIGSGYFDSLAGLLFFLLLGKVYQSKTFHLLAFDRDYKSYFPISVTKLVGDGELNVPVRGLQIGDRILVRNGELIPGDSRLLTGRARIDYSFVTGEAEPVGVALGEKVFAGGRQSGEPIELVIEKGVSQGYLTSIWNNAAFQKEKVADVTRVSERLGQRFTPVVLLIALAAALYWAIVDPREIWNVVTAVLIVACPCALALSTPFALGHTLRILGRWGFYLKGPAVVERLAGVDTLIFDKTGTLTHTDAAHVSYHGRSLTGLERDAVRGLLRASVHPLSRRLYQWLPSGDRVKVEGFKEWEGKGLQGWVDGKEIRLGSKGFVEGDGIPVTGSMVWVRIGGEVLGYFELQNALRPGSAELLKALAQGYTLGLLSGDHEGSRERMADLLPPGTELRFRQGPEDKMAFIEGLQAEGRSVAMIGDGLNDAGALQQSELGIAVTDDLTAFTPASDAILYGPSLQQLPAFLKLAKAGLRMVKWSFAVSFLYNVVGISFAVSAQLSPLLAAVLMPLSSLSVILFTTGGVSLHARRLLGTQSNLAPVHFSTDKAVSSWTSSIS